MITVAATAAAAPAPSKPAPPNKKPPVVKQPPVKAPTSDRHWYVYQQGKECFADTNADACPPPPKGEPARPCNPPPPTPYKCSDAKIEPLPFHVVQHAGSPDCFVDYGDQSCPPGMACNPPAPKKLVCPQ